MKCVCTLIFSLLPLSLSFGALDVPVYWPTPNKAFFEGKGLEAYVQPSSSGRVVSGLFGCTRNEGRRFHEGLDLKPLKRNRQNEPADEVYAILEGRVAYINKIAGNSSYGRYIVLEHTDLDIPFITLYAHLARVDDAIGLGQIIPGGARLGVMGRSANHPISKLLAHLHIELGLRLSDDFESWYNKQSFKAKNTHGQWNGYNFVGTDPLFFYYLNQKDKIQNMHDFVKSLKTDFRVRVYSSKVPNYIKRYPKLLEEPIRVGLVGWEIAFTWYGLPKQWRPLYHKEVLPGAICWTPALELVHYDKEVMASTGGAKTLMVDKKGHVGMGARLKRILELLFQETIKA